MSPLPELLNIKFDSHLRSQVNQCYAYSFYSYNIVQMSIRLQKIIAHQHFIKQSIKNQKIPTKTSNTTSKQKSIAEKQIKLCAHIKKYILIKSKQDIQSFIKLISQLKLTYQQVNMSAGVYAFVILSGLVGLAWAIYNYIKLKQIDLGQQARDQQLGKPLNSKHPGVVEIGMIIKEGASEFIWSQYKIISVFIVLMAAVVFFCVDQAKTWYTTIAFITGALTSMFCGAFGMKIATFSNYRTTFAAKNSLGSAFKTAYRAGCVMGFTLVSISMLVLLTLILIYKNSMSIDMSSDNQKYYQILFQSVAGYGLGGSTIAMFARVGGGIFTKAADLGSDLVGKVQQNLPEDSPKNPATIADNVGDNVGDVAGMGADLFGSFAESTCAALVISCSSIANLQGLYNFSTITFVLCIPAMGIFLSIATSAIITQGQQVQSTQQVHSSLKNQLIYSTVLLIPGLLLVTYACLQPFNMLHNDGSLSSHTYMDVFYCICYGLVAGLIIGYVTQVMTSYSYKPVTQLAESCRTGAATNIIYGLALGYLSTIIPVIVLCAVCYFSHTYLGYYGVALAALGMLSNLPICLAIDGYGPISDNAGGIAQMAELPEEVRGRTDVLDAAGNTTAAIGKGFAIGSATLVGLALYGAFMHSSYMLGSLTKGEMSFDDPMIFTSLLFGAMLPYAFSALTMKSVGKAAQGMIEEVRRQIRANPGILTGQTRPQYGKCIQVSTQSSLKQMILPGLLVTVTPFLLGFFFGPKALIGFLPGAIVSGVQMAVSASNTGGAWDNAKKYIEAGMMSDQGQVVKKGTEIHKAAVIGDTVGDPLKDTSGPSLNILIKLMAILSLVFCRYFSS